jgi:hypothetical protein
MRSVYRSATLFRIAARSGLVVVRQEVYAASERARTSWIWASVT